MKIGDRTPLEKTLENLTEGDVVVNEVGERRTVLRIPKVYVMSDWNDQTKAYSIYTADELKNFKYKPLQTDTIELFGKTYNKQDVVEGLKKLKPLI